MSRENDANTNNLTWLLIALSAVGFTLWHQSITQQLQTQFNTCQAEFKAFKDGVIYGR